MMRSLTTGTAKAQALYRFVKKIMLIIPIILGVLLMVWLIAGYLSSKKKKRNGNSNGVSPNNRI
ncbi:MAG: hypothetical protein NVV59_18085 [Chitinophagaceae bacterium]|nr:hypothetical protein [Chitinophagaceae bacterium]